MNRPIPPSAMTVAVALTISGWFTLPPAAFAAPADPFLPLGITLQPKVLKGSLPSWSAGNILIRPESDAIEIPVPALASQEMIGCFALTVVFQDNGDGGPVVEWQPKNGELVLLSSGLGENGIALGLNARTLLLSQSLALDGGTLRISFAGRFSRLISATLRPARELGIASLGAEFTPALVGKNEPVLTEDDISGANIKPSEGDSTEGLVIHAELSSLPRQLDAPGTGAGTLEFILPLGAKPQGSLIQADVAGLDPESWIEIGVNGESFGALGAFSFALNSPNALFSTSGRLIFAGWRPSSLFLPARLWKEGDNSVVLTLLRVAGDEGKSVFFRKVRIDLLFPPSGSPTPPPMPLTATNATNTAPMPSPSPQSSNTLSTGSQYGNPSPSLFHATPPLSLPDTQSITP